MFVGGNAAAQKEEIIITCIGNFMPGSGWNSDPVMLPDMALFVIYYHLTATSQDIVDFLCLNMIVFLCGSTREQLRLSKTLPLND